MEESVSPMTIQSIADADRIKNFTELSGELWMPVRGSGSRYYVSDMGRVLTTNQYGHERIALLKAYQTGKSARLGCGYLQVKLYLESGMRAVKVHRLVAEHFIPNRDNLPQVNHINRNQLDNRAVNLEWVTNVDNRRWSSSLDMEKVSEIRSSWELENALTKEQFCRMKARQYGVTRNCIRFVLNGQTWR